MERKSTERHRYISCVLFGLGVVVVVRSVLLFKFERGGMMFWGGCEVVPEAMEAIFINN